MDGLQNLIKLRRLNLSFNKLTNIEGLHNEETDYDDIQGFGDEQNDDSTTTIPG